MNKHNFFLFSLVLVLLLQIFTLKPIFSIPRISVGDILAFVPEEAFFFPGNIHQATLSSFERVEKNSLIFTGDIMLARNVEYLMRKEGKQYPFAALDFGTVAINAAVIGNFESAMSPAHITTPAFGMTFSTASSALPALSESGFTHLSLANNHSYDYGEDGYQNTVSLLLNNKLTPFGNGKSLGRESVTYVNIPHGRVALIAVNASEKIPDIALLYKIIVAASRQSDLQIVTIHWGTEYKETHSSTQELLAKVLVDAGADLIVGHHPHVVEDVQIVDGVVVFYSLGNYIFDQYFDDDVQTGLVLSLSLTGTPEVSLLPVTSLGHLSQPSFMSSAKQQEFLSNLAEKSDKNLAASIKKGVIPLPAMVASSQKTTMIVR